MNRVLNPVYGLDYIKGIATFKKDPLTAMESFRDQYGYLPYYGSPLKTVFLFHPEDVWKFLVNGKNDNVKADQARLLKVVLGDSLFIQEGDAWRKKKSIIQSVFHSQSIMGYSPLISSITERYVSKWKTLGVVNLSEEIMSLAFEISTKIFFGVYDEKKSKEVRDAITLSGKIISKKFASPIRIPFWVATPQNISLKKQIAILDDFTFSIIAEARLKNEDPSSLLGRLMNSSENLTDRQIRDEVITFMAAGYETTATFIIWTIYLMLKNPDSIQVFKESEKHSSERKHILNEGLRLYPSFPINARQNIREMEIGGQILPAGTNFVISPYVIHRDQKFWKDPLAFNPDRYRNLAPEVLRQQFLPFLAGPKKCIGEILAYEEGERVIETIFTNADLELMSTELSARVDVILYSDRPLLVKVS